MAKNLILDNSQISQKIRRMAHEVYEHNYDEKEIVILGIKDQGMKLAINLEKELKAIFPIKYHLLAIDIVKKAPSNFKQDVNIKREDLSNKVLLFVDDVLNSGRTLMYAIRPFMDFNPSKIQVAVLINRDHTTFPIVPDYTGLSLSTTLQDHIEVECNKKDQFSAYLL